MSYINVVSFVDWKSQIHNAKAIIIADPKKRADITLKYVVNSLAKALVNIDAYSRFIVRLRLYHGWHRGLTPTENRRALLELENSPDLDLPRFEKVRFELPFEYGEKLLQAIPYRLREKSPAIHLPDTLRSDPDDKSIDREKMVDTALACDMLTHSRSDPKEWRIVMAEDDDLIPALFVSEVWSKNHGGRTILLRTRGESKHINLRGLLKENS